MQNFFIKCPFCNFFSYSFSSAKSSENSSSTEFFYIISPLLNFRKMSFSLPHVFQIIIFPNFPQSFHWKKFSRILILATICLSLSLSQLENRQPRSLQSSNNSNQHLSNLKKIFKLSNVKGKDSNKEHRAKKFKGGWKHTRNPLQPKNSHINQNLKVNENNSLEVFRDANNKRLSSYLSLYFS